MGVPLVCGSVENKCVPLVLYILCICWKTCLVPRGYELLFTRVSQAESLVFLCLIYAAQLVRSGSPIAHAYACPCLPSAPTGLPSCFTPFTHIILLSAAPTPRACKSIGRRWGRSCCCWEAAAARSPPRRQRRAPSPRSQWAMDDAW